MNLATEVGCSIQKIFDTPYQTYTVSARFQRTTEKIYYLYIGKIDTGRSEVTLETLDIKKNTSLEEWRDIGKAYKIVTMMLNQNKIVLNVPESCKDTFPTTSVKYILNTGEQKNAVFDVHAVQHLNIDAYVVTMKQYVHFLGMVVTKNQQVPPSK